MKKVLLTILDGFGYREEKKGNAIIAANPKNIKDLWEKYPHTLLEASATAVGLPAGQMGNSEVGHLNIGAGRMVYQPQESINMSIADKTFYKNEKILEVMRHCQQQNSKLHLMGLISDGGVHSHIDHLMALLDLCKQENITKLYLHLFTDGRDVSPTSSYSYLQKVQDKLKELGIGKIATIGGRYYAMDRDNNYDRVNKAYDVIIHGENKKHCSIQEYIEQSYQNDITDEFLIPALFDETGTLEEDDGLIVFNYRKDRLRELLTAITNQEFNEFETVKFNNLKAVTMFPVVSTVKAPHAFDDTVLKNNLGEYIEKCNLKQLRIAETEKYAHVTFFFDGGKEVDYAHEDKILIPSPKVATYDLKPEMSAYEITKILLDEMQKYDLIILNYANCDMVGHTGNFEAAKKAIQVVDENVKVLYDKAQELGFTMFITADHGNIEIMEDEDGNVITSHTTSPVPFIVTDNDVHLIPGKLSDLAPTILNYMDLEVPDEMTGHNLIRNN